MKVGGIIAVAVLLAVLIGAGSLVMYGVGAGGIEKTFN